jgi:ATP phosphoribosyltransferase regulatory subunit
LQIGFDLPDLSGYSYYSGLRFAVYAHGSAEALVRGGRYDHVGAVFGRNRPAVGFSLDLKSLALLATATRAPKAIRAPWGEDADLRQAVRRLRDAGEIVLSMLPGDDAASAQTAPAFECDRELTLAGGQWVVRSLASAHPHAALEGLN